MVCGSLCWNVVVAMQKLKSEHVTCKCDQPFFGECSIIIGASHALVVDLDTRLRHQHLLPSPPQHLFQPLDIGHSTNHDLYYPSASTSSVLHLLFTRFLDHEPPSPAFCYTCNIDHSPPPPPQYAVARRELLRPLEASTRLSTLRIPT